MPFPLQIFVLLPMFPIFTSIALIQHGLFNDEELAQAAHRDKLVSIGVLSASINHEIKNPLFIMKGLAESCLDRQKEGVFSNDKKALESANQAFVKTMEQADRAMDIIRRLSLFAKSGIESEIKFESISIAHVLEDILPLVRHELAINQIALNREIPNDLPKVLADRRYLEEIFFNLLVNAAQAIKAAGKSGAIFIHAADHRQQTAACSLQSAVCSQVVISISDNGPGIPEEKLKDVFRPFYTTKEEGTGLGLYITKQLVEKIKGRIEVASPPAKPDACLPARQGSRQGGVAEELGKGTEFEVTLNAVKREELKVNKY